MVSAQKVYVAVLERLGQVIGGGFLPWRTGLPPLHRVRSQYPDMLLEGRNSLAVVEVHV